MGPALGGFLYALGPAVVFGGAGGELRAGEPSDRA